MSDLEQRPWGQTALPVDLSAVNFDPFCTRLITEPATILDLLQDAWEVPNVSTNLRQHCV